LTISANVEHYWAVMKKALFAILVAYFLAFATLPCSSQAEDSRLDGTYISYNSLHTMSLLAASAIFNYEFLYAPFHIDIDNLGGGKTGLAATALYRVENEGNLFLQEFGLCGGPAFVLSRTSSSYSYVGIKGGLGYAFGKDYYRLDAILQPELGMVFPRRDIFGRGKAEMFALGIGLQSLFPLINPYKDRLDFFVSPLGRLGHAYLPVARLSYGFSLGAKPASAVAMPVSEPAFAAPPESDSQTPLSAESAASASLPELAGIGTSAQVQDAIAAGQDVDAKDAKGRSALMYAALLARDPEIVEKLLDAGADAAAKDVSGKTAFDYAQRNDALKGSPVVARLQGTTSKVAEIQEEKPKSREPRLRLYGGLGFVPAGFVATSLNGEGFPGGFLFGASALVVKVAAVSLGIDASYLPLLTTNGEYGTASASAVPILFTVFNGGISSGVGVSILRASGSLVGSEDASGVNFTTCVSYSHTIATPGLFFGIKSYELFDFDPLSADISLGLVVGLSL
jgi:hypothetical protein